MCSLLRLRVSTGTKPNIASLLFPVSPCLQLQSWTWGGKYKRIISKDEFVLVHAVKVYGGVEA